LWHITESFSLEGSTSIYIERKDKRSNAGGNPARRWQTQTHTMEVKAKQNTNTRVKAHNTEQMRQSSRPLHYKHKISNVFLVYTVRRTNETFFDKARVHNFPFRSVEISSGKHTITGRGSCKIMLNINLRPLRPPAWSTSTPRFSPVGTLRRRRP
jgi:hypothetical protein